MNAANSGLMGGGGVDGAIHRAGGAAILNECKKIVAERGRLSTGEAVITGSGNLKARHVIHTVGPVWRDGKSGEPELLRSCYLRSLEIAEEKGIKSISFPSISTGAYGYPVKEAAKVALKAVADFARRNSSIESIILVLFDERTFNAYRDELLGLKTED